MRCFARRLSPAVFKDSSRAAGARRQRPERPQNGPDEMFHLNMHTPSGPGGRWSEVRDLARWRSSEIPLEREFVPLNLSPGV